MLLHLIQDITNGIKYEIDGDGKVIKKERGLIPVIDERTTKDNMKQVTEELLKKFKVDEILTTLKSCVSIVKDNYVETHDGFKAIGNIEKSKRISVGDIYAFSVAIGYIFEFLPIYCVDRGQKIGIGVLYPAGQDTGKNLIKLVWRTSGYEIIDLGKQIKPKQFVQAAIDMNLSLLAVSCMSGKCLSHLDDLLQQLNNKNMHIPVIIGGIAVNKIVAFDLSRKYGINVYYGHDINDANVVLEKAISKQNIEIPDIKVNTGHAVTPQISSLIKEHNFRLTFTELDNIIIDNNARDGCKKCSGDKKSICPLELGYEKQKSIEESKDLLDRFKFAVIVSTEIPDETKRQTCKSIWLHLLKLEQHLELEYGSTFSFKFPMICPFCKTSDCRLIKGECMFPTYYRPLHEQYNINITETLKNVFGDDIRAEMHSIILIGDK